VDPRLWSKLGIMLIRINVWAAVKTNGKLEHEKC